MRASTQSQEDEQAAQFGAVASTPTDFKRSGSMPEPIPARLEPAAGANSEAILTENAQQEHMVLQE